MAGLLRPTDLKMLASDAEAAKMNEERQAKKKKDQQQLEMREAFMTRDVHPEAIDRINRAVRTAAEQGLHEVQVFTFPSTYCNDRGRMINIGDPAWPTSLEGFAKRAFEFFEKELRPLGYKVHAEIISFPDGIPGDVGMYLKW